MDPAVAIPLHFSLEFVGVAAVGALLAWAVHRRAPVAAGGALLLFVSAALHGGLFVTGERDPWVLGLRLVGLAGLAVAIRREAVRTDGAPGAAVPAAAGGGSAPLAAATGALAAAVAIGHRELPDRELWASGWVGVAVGELWLAVADIGSLPLEGTLGVHLLRAAGFALVGAWVWRRAQRSLRLRVIAAFILVLLVIVAVAGGAVTRVGTADARRNELRTLSDEAQAGREVFLRDNQALRDDAAIVSRTLGATPEGERERVARAFLDQVFTEVAFIAFVRPDGTISVRAGLDPGEEEAVTGASSTAAALAGGDVPPVSVELASAGLVVVAAAPTTDGADGATVLGRRYGAPSLVDVASTGNDEGDEEAVLVAIAGEVLAASSDDLDDLDVPVTTLRSVAEGNVWRGEIDSGRRTFFAAAAPLDGGGEGPAPAALVVVSPEPDLAATALDLARTFFGAVLAAALVAVLIALWMSSRIVRPLLSLTRTAERVEEGDLEATPDVESPDEIGTLAHAFGSMTASLRDTIASEQGTRRRLQTIVDGMGEGLVAMDDDFNVTSFNPAAERITGVAASDAIGSKCHEVYGELTRGPEGKPICDYICPLRHGGGVDGGVAMETADGRTLGVAVTCSTLRDADGRVVGGVDLLRDVTPQLQAEQMKSNFLANISHELRTPLTPIRGYADILKRKELSKEKAGSYLDEIISSARRLERIVQILVDVAAMEAGRLEVEPRPVSPRDLVGDAVQRWDGRSTTHDVRPRVPKRIAQVEADATMVGRVLDELIDNAVKFSPDGGTVTVRAKASDGAVEFSVRDEGIGIDVADIDELFEEFVQADPSETRRFGGLGVGLPFVRRIVEAHSGELTVSSRPGRGSTFAFVLPAAPKRTGKRPGRKRTRARS